MSISDVEMDAARVNDKTYFVHLTYHVNVEVDARNEAHAIRQALVEASDEWPDTLDMGEPETEIIDGPY